MSYTPNIKAARARFVERVANAYFQTWAAYGFMGEEYSFERAEQLAQSIAECSFPGAPPVFELPDLGPRIASAYQSGHMQNLLPDYSGDEN